MNLSNFSFRPDYYKGKNNIAEEFYLPCMHNSIKYDRITGYFGSTVYTVSWPALKTFINNGGKMRIICSPFISNEDINALRDGYEARDDRAHAEILCAEIQRMLSDNYLNKPARVLAGLVAMGKIDLKIAIIGDNATIEHKRLFHDKVGIFYDFAGNSVGFRGSMNETFKGLSADGNMESIDVFPSWYDGRDTERAQNATAYFEDLWNGEIPFITVNDFPEVAINELVKAADPRWEELLDEICIEINKAKKLSADQSLGGKRLKPHQVTAIENWTERGRRGILQYATGSGKTFIALSLIRECFAKNETPVVLVPSQKLSQQWEKEISDVLQDLQPQILICGSGNIEWKKNQLLTHWSKPSDKHRIILSTMQTASNDSFLSMIREGSHLFFIADEVHRLGSPEHRKIMRLNTGPRLGLSATPKRSGDPIGTHMILDYFEGIVDPPYTLEDGIKNGVLAPYMYFPHAIKLTKEEQKDWDNLTVRLKKKIAQKKGKDREAILEDNKIKLLLIERARILKNAKGKIGLALDVIRKYYKKGQRWIVYCDNQDQLYDVLKILRKNGFDANEYHSAMAGDREATIRHFEINGGILVSIRCLDEGVDIPSVTHGLILASSKNIREFIQRRGRILRLSANKFLAFLHDAIVIHGDTSSEPDNVLSILEAELARAIEFGKSAMNPSAISYLELIAVENGIDLEKIIEGGYEDDDE